MRSFIEVYMLAVIILLGTPKLTSVEPAAA